MKKVRKESLIRLIHNIYRIYIVNISKDEYYDLPFEYQAHVNVESVYIELWWKIEEEIDVDTKNVIENFSKTLEEISFGNLKVVSYGKDKINNKDILSIFIANAYEVIE